MYELVQTGERSYYINCPAKVGIYKQNDTDIFLIDSGNDKEAGKKILKIVSAQNWKIKAIINTHSNADHIGGNHYIQQQTGCNIFANGIEVAFTQYPILESSFLYGGYPCKDLRHKFLLAAQSDVLDINDELFPKELEVIPLHGHFFQMIGIRTPDQTVFIADCISSEITLEKYQIPFIYDVEKYIETLHKVEEMKANIFVPAHAEATNNIKPIILTNSEKVIEIANKLCEICEIPIAFDDILKRIFNEYHLTMNFEQHVLVGSTIRSFLSWLKDNNRLGVEFIDQKLMWYSILSNE